MLVELAREEAGHVPEVSYGTHFFQDLVEQHIMYLPVFPADAAAEYNAPFFSASPNLFRHFLPDMAGFENLVKVIDVPAATGCHAHVMADPESRQAVCFLE